MARLVLEENDGQDPGAAPVTMRRWWRGPDPDPAEVTRLYVRDRRTETEIAVLLSISWARVAAVLLDAGIARRTPVRPARSAPTGSANWSGRATAASVARDFEVATSTSARWFAEAGLLRDPGVDERVLRELYVDRLSPPGRSQPSWESARRG